MSILRYSFGKPFKVPGKQTLKYGIYLTSLCDALRLSVLTPYHLVISNLEKSLLTEHYLNVTFLQTHLELHFVLFSAICNLLTELERKQLHGCQIIDLVYRYSISGNMVVKETCNQILRVTQEVMYKQLRDWMVCGCLNDKYEEFFICIDEKKQTELQLAGMISQQTMIDSIMGEDTRAEVNEAEEMLLGNHIRI